MRYVYLMSMLFLLSCEQKQEQKVSATWVPYDQSAWIAENQDHPSKQMQYKHIQSLYQDKNQLWSVITPQLADFSAAQYEELKPLIFDRSIRELQNTIKEEKLTYKLLTQWYLYRIMQLENDSSTALNNIISINPEAVKTAELRDADNSEDFHMIYGMPILLKDNVNTEGMPTTAGAAAFLNNTTNDAFIVDRIQEKGGIILGKTNLSEWANFLCDGCPNGYSATGGQTLNPYGPRKFDTGGSSSGSGSTIAANYAVAAVGTETSGSILSPSSAQSLVGLKPTVGLLSRSGIVPISSTLDTPGPMTKNVDDNAILLSAMLGKDSKDEATQRLDTAPEDFLKGSFPDSLQGVRLGAIKSFMEDSLYEIAVKDLEALGAEVIIIEPEQKQLNGFLTLLNADMKKDMSSYLSDFANAELPYENMNDLLVYNRLDSNKRIPYGQARFIGVVNESITSDSLEALVFQLKTEGTAYFAEPMEQNELDGILSINNWSAGYAAVAHYPCLTVPMGYEEGQKPKGLTFVAPRFHENQLLHWAHAYEKATKRREAPKAYQ